MKIVSREKELKDLPNVGKRMEEALRAIGIQKPSDIKKWKAFDMYVAVSAISKCGRNEYHGVYKEVSLDDPCVLDVCLALVDYISGSPARPWFSYTKKRKELYPDLKRL